ncbi:MAG: MBL fold metallo-hydrolase [Methanoregula sp.]|nr:MAG: MBL fold metallo-hydrolase [Methanoregula sp.]
MQCTILASGSKGNCMLIEGSCGALLIDAGLSAKEIIKRLTSAGKQTENILAILVTHEHGDHISGVDVLSRRLQIPVFATRGTLHDFLTNRRKSGKPLDIHSCTYNNEFCIGDFLIEPFATSHDANEPCGFCIMEEGIRLGCCTDTGIVNPGMLSRLLRCDGVVLESNHCPEMLKNGPYPESLKRRIRSARGHLSNNAASLCLQTLGRDVHSMILAHVSEVNNTPEKVRLSAQNGLGLLYGETSITIATQAGTSDTCPQVLNL